MTGVICIDKPSDMTSFGAVAKVRGMTKEKKVGHTGTLDPMATGVLPMLLGGATRFLDYLPDSDKGYRASFRLGMTTDTLDSTGTVLSEQPVTVGEAEVRAVLEDFRRTIEQLPPMYSAKSVDGVRLYELARQGIEVERKPCTVTIKALTLTGANGNDYEIEVLCSKGTYIRSLIDDIGKKLGCGAVMTALERTQAMGFTKADCVSLQTLQARRDNGEGFDDLLIGIETLFADYPKVYISPAQAKRFQNGGALDIARIKKPPLAGVPCAVYTAETGFLGLGCNEASELKVLRLLTRRD